MAHSPYILLPSKDHAHTFQSTPRFFFRLDGVLANFTTLAAELLDDLKLPFPEDGVFEEDLLRAHFADDVLFDVCHGRAFWERVQTYPWSWMMFERAFTLSHEQVYFIGKAYKSDSNSWGGKAAWMHKNFGFYGIDHLFVTLNSANMCMLNNGKNDILVTALKVEAEEWCLEGGSALYFRELDIRHAGTAQEVAKRLIAMNEIVELVK